MAVIIPLERKLAKRTTLQCIESTPSPSSFRANTRDCSWFRCKMKKIWMKVGKYRTLRVTDTFFEKLTFFESTNSHFYFASSLWKSDSNYGVAWMELNSYDYHCFQLKVTLIFFLANVPTKEDHLKAIVLLGEYYNISSIVEFQRWWVLKCKIFAQESTCPKDIVLKQSSNELWFIKKCWNYTFKVNFLSQKSTKFKKKLFKNINLGDHLL